MNTKKLFMDVDFNHRVLAMGLVSEIEGLKDLLDEKFRAEFRLGIPATIDEKEIVRFFNETTPELLVLAMKGANGPSLLRRIKEDGKLRDVPLLYIGEGTGAGDSLDDERDFFISSPLNLGEVGKAVKKMVYMRRLSEKYDDLVKREMDHSKWTFMGNILSGIIHDINNSLTVVGLNMGLVTMLLGKKEWKEEYQEKGRKFSLEVEKGLNQVNVTLSNVRSFINSGLGSAERPERMPVTIKEILEEGLKLCLPEIKKKRAELKIILSPEVERYSISVDKTKITEMVMYLVLNSIEPFKRPEDGKENLLKIEGSLLASGNSEVFQLCLTSNAEVSKKESLNFQGIGLNLVQKIIEDHKGKVYRSDGGGVGLQWVIQLPKSD